MLKFIFIALTAITLSLWANNNVIESEDIPAVNICDKVYDDCALKCEGSDVTNVEQCYANCEKLYDQCLEEKSTVQTEEK